jgi:hypothetical protein
MVVKVQSKLPRLRYLSYICEPECAQIISAGEARVYLYMLGSVQIGPLAESTGNEDIMKPEEVGEL